MNKELAEKVYRLILEKVNGWEEEQLKGLSKEDIYCDPIFENLCELE